jgi:xanthine dehydrogenase YagS FAD-binding subunit
MENFTLAVPVTIEAALAAAQQADAKFIAGGTDLLQLMKDNVERPQRLVDLEGLPLDTFSIGADGARIGALIRMSDLADDPTLRRHYPVIAEALLASASPQVRNVATIGGNLLQRTPAAISAMSDFPPATSGSRAPVAVRFWD